MTQTNDSVFVLVIEHKHGNAIAVFEDRELALDDLHAWAREYWDDDEEPLPAERDDAIEAYFDRYGFDENWYIEEVFIDRGSKKVVPA